MKAFFRLLLVVAFSQSTALAQTDTITIVHVNDSHSNLSPLGPRDASLNGTIGGLARVATVLENTRSTDRNVLFIHAGDFSTGDVYFNFLYGIPELKILQYVAPTDTLNLPASGRIIEKLVMTAVRSSAGSRKSVL